MVGNRRNEHRTRLLEKFSMSSATDLTKAWLESLPTDVDEPTPTTRAPPHRSTESRTQDARNVDDRVRSSSVSAHSLRKPQSRGDTNDQVKQGLLVAKVSTSAQSKSIGLAGVNYRSGNTRTSQPTDEESSDVDKAFAKLLGDFSVPGEIAEVEQLTTADAEYTSPQHELEGGGRKRQTSKSQWSKPTVIKERTGQRKLPLLDGRNQINPRQERSAVDDLTEQGRDERKEMGQIRSNRDARDLRCNSMSPSYRAPVKAFNEYKPQNSFMQTASESDAIKDSMFKKPFRNSIASSANRTYQSSRDFATQTFGQMVNTPLANSEVQTEISAVTKSDEMLKTPFTNIREPDDKYFSQHSLESATRDVASSRQKMAADDRMNNNCSRCRTNSSKSLHRDVETSRNSNGRVISESFDDSVEKWSKKEVRSAENTVVESDRFYVHSKRIPAADTASLKSRSLSSTSNSRRLMSLMLDEVKALKSFVQTHLDEHQTTDRVETSQTRTRPRLEDKNPDSDSAVELATIDKASKKRDSERSKHRSHHKTNKSGKHGSRRRRTEDEENEYEYHRRRRSPMRENTWDDNMRRRTSGEDMRNRYLSMTEDRRHLDSVGVASAYNSFPHNTHPSNYQRYMPVTGVNPTAVYQSPFQLYQNRNVVPYNGFGQPSTMLTPYQADLGNRLGYAPMTTHPLMYNTMPAGHTFPLRVPYPNSVAVVPAAVEPAAYQARPALTFVPVGVAPVGQAVQSIQSAWSPRGQFLTKDNDTSDPNRVRPTDGREIFRAKRNEPSTQNSHKSGSQPRRLRNSLTDALREAQGIRNLTERIGKDIQLPSYCY